MATNTSGQGVFVDRFGRVYWTYALCFAAFVILAAILEQVGVPDRVLGYLFVLFTLGAYATIGVVARTMQVAEFYASARRVPALYNGMAGAADWISGAMFLGLAGTVFVLGFDALALILGLGGGFVLIAVLIAPFLRKFGAYTVPDFLALRFGGIAARLTGIVVLLACSLAYLTAQIHVTGIIAARFLGIDFGTAIVIALATVLMSTVLGGMRSLTWTQVGQFIIVIVALFVPAVITAVELTGNPIPQLAYVEVLPRIAALETALVGEGMAAAGEITPHLTPFASLDRFNLVALALCLMIGTASLPHVLMRSFTTRSVRETRVSTAWTLLFVMLALTIAPAYAAFAKLEIYDSVIGASIAALPDWIATFSGPRLVEIYGLSVDAVGDHMVLALAAIAAGARDAAGVAATLGDADRAAWENLAGPVRAAIYNAVSEDPGAGAAEVWRRAIFAAAVTAGDFDARLRLHGFAIDRDAILIAAPEIAGLPFVFAGVVAAGALAAALSTANGLLVAIANSLSHDVYYRTLDPEASTSKRLVVARVLLIAIAAVAGWLAAYRPGDIMSVVAWAFSLAASGFFPALVLGIWWKRASSAGAVAGMIAGFAAALSYLVVTRYAPEFGAALGMTPLNAAPGGLVAGVIESVPDAAGSGAEVGWFGLSNVAAALIGVPVGFMTMFAVSFLTPAPPATVQDFVEDIRTPRGLSHMEKERAAERVREFGRGRR